MCSILGVFDLRPGADLHPLRPLALSLSAPSATDATGVAQVLLPHRQPVASDADAVAVAQPQGRDVAREKGEKLVGGAKAGARQHEVGSVGGQAL